MKASLWQEDVSSTEADLWMEVVTEQRIQKSLSLEENVGWAVVTLRLTSGRSLAWNRVNSDRMKLCSKVYLIANL